MKVHTRPFTARGRKGHVRSLYGMCELKWLKKPPKTDRLQGQQLLPAERPVLQNYSLRHGYVFVFDVSFSLHGNP